MNMITKNIIECDKCHSSDIYPKAKSEAKTVSCAKQSGWIISGDKHYCCDSCCISSIEYILKERVKFEEWFLNFYGMTINKNLFSIKHLSYDDRDLNLAWYSWLGRALLSKKESELKGAQPCIN